MNIMQDKTNKIKYFSVQPDAGLPSLFDPDEAAQDDLWFLPEPADNLGQTPLPKSNQRLLFDPADWSRAQGDLSGELAALTMRFGALEERLGVMGNGLRQQLAIREACELSWWTGTRIGADRLTLWIGLRTGGGMDDSLALAQAGWAVRRLAAGQAPYNGGWQSGIAAFLGHPQGTVSHPIDELAEVMTTAQYLHPVTQAAVLFHSWRIAGQGPARDIEAAVMAACHGASMGQAKAPFLPLALSGLQALQASGTAHTRLAGWISGAEKATLAALMHLERLANWQKTARHTLADLTGRTPNLLVDLLAIWPMVSAPMAEEQTGTSRAAVQRNLEIMQARGVVREITGQGRYRVWAARL